jgi:predicted ArsR family transcriptional regulator
MSDMSESIAFALPKKPRIREKEPMPDQRKVCVLPIRAITDKALTDNMLRILAVLCSYCNRAGFTWVSQKKLAEDMKVSRQAITKQMAKLIAAGYVEVVRKGFRGERSNTVRVIFDITVDTATAIAVTNSIEDTRPPVIRQEQAMAEQQEIDRAGQARIAKLIGQALRNNQPRKEPTMAEKKDSMTVRKMKEEIAKKKPPKDTAYATPGVAHVEHSKVANEALHRQPHRQPNRVARNTREHIREDNIKVNSLNTIKDNLRLVLGNQVPKLIEFGLTDQDIDDGLATLLAIYAAEGITPKEQHLVEGLMQMKRDAS